MILYWIGALIVLLVVAPVVVYLLNGVLQSAESIVPGVDRIAKVAAAGSKDLDAVPLLLTTQERVKQTLDTIADYGGSLNTIIDDAPAS